MIETPRSFTEQITELAALTDVALEQGRRDEARRHLLRIKILAADFYNNLRELDKETP